MRGRCLLCFNKVIAMPMNDIVRRVGLGLVRACSHDGAHILYKSPGVLSHCYCQCVPRVDRFNIMKMFGQFILDVGLLGALVGWLAA